MFLYYIFLFVEIVVFEMVCLWRMVRVVRSCSNNQILQDLSVLLCH